MALLIVMGCTRPVAVVNGEKIDKKTLDLHVQERILEHKQRNAEVTQAQIRDGVLQELIAERLILAEARLKGITGTEEEVSAEIASSKKSLGDEGFDKALKEKGLSPESYRQRIREKIIMNKFIRSLVSDSAVAEEEIQNAYKESPKPFVKSARVKITLIEFPVEEKAAAALRELKDKGTDIETLSGKLAAADPSISSTSGWSNPDFFSPQIAHAIKNLKVGQTGGPYQGKKGFYIIRVDDREKETIAKYEEVRENIRAMLLDQRRQSALQHWLSEKKANAKIVITLK